jgi:hypothetical protein
MKNPKASHLNPFNGNFTLVKNRFLKPVKTYILLCYWNKKPEK